MVGFRLADQSALAAINRALRGCRVRSPYPCSFVTVHYRDVKGNYTTKEFIEAYTPTEEEDAGLAYRGANDVSALRRTHHGVRDFWIGDQHVLDLAGQIDHHGFADAKR